MQRASRHRPTVAEPPNLAVVVSERERNAWGGRVIGVCSATIARKVACSESLVGAHQFSSLPHGLGGADRMGADLLTHELAEATAEQLADTRP